MSSIVPPGQFDQQRGNYADVKPFVRRKAPEWSGLWPTVVARVRFLGKQRKRLISCHCLQLVTKGKVRFFLENREDAVLGMNELFLIEPDVPFFYHSATTGFAEVYAINLIGPLADAFVRSLGFDSGKLHFSVSDPPLLFQLFEQLGDLAQQHGPAIPHKVVSVLHEFPLACSNLSSCEDSEVSFVERVMDHVHTHLELGENVEQLAERFCVSRYTMFLKFRDQIGQSPSEAIRSVRISQAKQLLENTDLRVSEIRRLCGYRSVEHFVRQFQEIVGAAPTAWRLSDMRHPRAHKGVD
jgi:AraC-like DNA-binding protein